MVLVFFAAKIPLFLEEHEKSELLYHNISNISMAGLGVLILHRHNKRMTLRRPASIAFDERLYMRDKSLLLF
jgi:hypothetical protein